MKIKKKNKNKNKYKKKNHSENLLTPNSDEDGVLIFQFNFLKPPWILKKIKSLFNVDQKNEKMDDSSFSGSRV